MPTSLAAGEEDDGRDREDVVAARDPRMLVDVELRDGHALLELGQDRLEGLARTAPRRPEVDEERAAADGGVESGGVELVHQMRPVNASNRSAGTRVTASRKIAWLIFELPAVRSAKRIGTSTTPKPSRIGAVRRLDLERVALRADRVEVDRLEHLPAVALEAARQVADVDAEERPRVPRAAGRDEAPPAAPVLGAAARDVPRAQARGLRRRRRPARAGRRPPGRARSRSPSRGCTRRLPRARGGTRRCRRGRGPPSAAGGGRRRSRAPARGGRRSRRCRPASCRR